MQKRYNFFQANNLLIAKFPQPSSHTSNSGRHRVQLVGGLLLEPLIRGSKPSGVRMFLRGWGLGPHMSNQGTLVRRCQKSLKNHPTLTRQNTRNWVSLSQLVSHEWLSITLPITGRRHHMVARQLKLWEGLIKSGLWCM